MKKLTALLLLSALLMTAAACARGVQTGQAFDEIGYPQVVEESGWGAPYEEDYGIDLSAYDDHGEWSYDRMWVHKTEESWDALRGYYGYIDREGNLIGQWHPDEAPDNSNAETFLLGEVDSWTLPGDFYGEYAVVLCDGTTRGAGGRGFCEIINASGETVHRFVIDNSYVYFYNNSKPYLDMFARLLSQSAVFYCDGVDKWDNPVCMMKIENGKVITHNYGFEHILEDPELEYDNGCYEDISVCESYNETNSSVWLFDENGQWYFEDYIEGYEVTEITSTEYNKVDMEFIGADGREYAVVLDLEGNWLTEPKLAE